MKVLAACSTNVAARSRPSAVANSSEIRAQSVTLETSPPYLVVSLNQIRHAWLASGPGLAIGRARFRLERHYILGMSRGKRGWKNG